ncbi:hypothetical protein BDN72DRAFT_901567 [Pluteus cervinus]|uniref:Uncharacterized protein n=1 Tax=Pluteus cervinus TaxID=181527 RepID=A0ACD3AFU9_9AGAR|nr:hypothetical protein BDN72DRAFT_901567 [Pluteus cervinus]
MATLPVHHPSTFVHAVLSTSELARIICFHLLDVLGPPNRSSTLLPLLYLALSCRWLSYSALEAIWSRLSSIKFLLQTLPPNSWETTDPNNAYGSFIKPKPALRTLTAEDCSRFRMYCTFMKTVTTDLLPFDPKFFDHLERMFGPQLPLLQLKCLIWTDSFELPLNPFSTHFFVPSLKAVKFRVDDGGRGGYDKILPKLLEICPGLRTIEFTDFEVDYRYKEPMDKLSGIFLHWKHLTNLEIPAISTEVFAQLAMGNDFNNGLATLRIGDMQHVDWEAFGRSVQSRTGFANLKHLALSEISLKGALRVLGTSRTSLTTLMLEIRSILLGSDWETLFQAVRGGVDVDQIELLALSEAPYQTWNIADERVQYPDTIGSDHLSTLLPLKNLRSLYLCATYGFNINDTSIGALARGMSKLESLQFSTTRRNTMWPPTLTFHGLAQLALGLPELQTLSLQFDAYNVRPFDSATHAELVSPQRRSSTTFLDVRLSPILRPTSAAEMLHDIFPNLEVLRSERMYSLSVTHALWMDVKNILGLQDDRRLLNLLNMQ